MKNRLLSLILVLVLLFTSVGIADETNTGTAGEGTVAVTETSNEPEQQPEPEAPAAGPEQLESEEPAATEPEQTEPEEPAATEPEQTESEAPAATEPEQTEPVAPAATEPEQTEPVAPAATEPEQTEPEEPAATEPEQTEPVEPAATEPEQTESGDPAATEPEQTESEETEPEETQNTDPEQTETETPDSIESEQSTETTPVESLIDYSRSCKYSPAFTQGYVSVTSGAELFADENDAEPYATVSRGTAYVVKRVNINETKDRLKVAFAKEGAVISAYIAASDLKPMTEQAVGEYIQSCEKLESDERFEYSNGIYVDQLTVTLIETEPENNEPEGTEPENTEPENTEVENTEAEGTEPENNEPEGTEPENTEPENTEVENTEAEGTEPENTEPEGIEPENTEPENTEVENTEAEGTEPEDTEPEGTEPEGTEPEGTEVENTEAEGTEPEDTEPEGTEPEGTEPEGTEPEGTEPEGTEPEGTEPQNTEPEGTEPEGIEPEGTEPEGTEPEGTEPEGTEPEGTEPEGTEPEGTEPEGTEPEGTEPEGTEPEGTEPEGTEPEGTEPEGTEPEGTEPEGTKPEGTEPENREPEPAPVVPDHIKFVSLPSQIGIGETYNVNAVVCAADDTEIIENVTLTLSETSCAELNGSELTALSAGNFILNAVSESGLTCEYKVEVLKAPVSISFDRNSIVISTHEHAHIGVTLSQGSAGSLTWTSSVPEAASVDASGEIIGGVPGTAVITAKTFNGFVAQCAVTVLGEPTDIVLSTDTIELEETTWSTLEATFTGDVTGTVEFSVTEGSDIIEISESGKNALSIHALYSGVAQITASVYNASLDQTFTQVCTITVIPRVVSIGFNNLCTTIGVGELVDIQPVAYDARGNEIETTFAFATGTPKYVALKSGNRLYGAAKGKSKITVRAASGVYTSFTVNTVAAPTSIKLNLGAVTLNTAQTVQLMYALSSGSASAITWVSSNENVATVDANGLVTAVGPGSTYITALTYKSNIKKACTVTVYDAPEALAFGSESYTVQEGMTVATGASYLPEGSWGSITYSIVEGSEFASVNPTNGVVTGILYGTATVQASVHDYANDTDVVTTATVEVIPKAEHIVLGNTRTVVGVGELIDLCPKAYDRFGNEVEIGFSLKTSSASYVKVGATRIQGVKVGSAIVTIKAANGISIVVTYTVKKAPTKISLSSGWLDLSVGQTANLTYALSSGSVSGITWTSSDETVATVDNGHITAVSEGSALITCSTYKSGVYARCTVNVHPAPVGVEFLSDVVSVKENGSVQLSVKLLPEGAVGAVTYSISYDDELALAEVSGATLKGKYSGAATLTATVHNYVTGEDISSSCPVEILPAPVRMAFMWGRTTIGLKETVDLMATAYDARGNVLDETPALSSSSATYIKITSGKAYGAKTGTATVTATASNGLRISAKIKVVAAPTKVTISAGSAVLSLNETVKLTAYTTAGQKANIRWTSSDPSVADVDDDGLVTAYFAGSAVITAASYNGKTASCRVTVGQAPENISFAQEVYTVNEGSYVVPEVRLAPEGSVGTVSYTVSYSDEEYVIASCDNGTKRLNGITSGEATLTATVHNYVTGADINCSVPVYVQPAPVSIAFGSKPSQLGLNEVRQLAPKAYDARGNEIETTFALATSNKSYVAVSGTAIKGVKNGSANITVTTANGVRVVFAVKVVNAPTKITLSAAAVNVQQGDPVALRYSLPSGSNGNVDWMSDNDAVLTSEGNGTFTAHEPGIARVTARTYNGKVAYCTVYVKPSPESITINRDELRLAVGSSVVLSTSFNSTDALATVKFETSESSILTVDANTGRVTAVSEGIAVITARAHSNALDMDVTDELTVQAVKTPESFETTLKMNAIGVGETITLTPAAYDEDGNKVEAEFSVSSSATKYISVSGMTIKGLRTGSSNITVAIKNGIKYVVKVTVMEAPSSVKLSSGSLNIAVNEGARLTYSLPAKRASRVTFTSENSAIVTVDENGNLIGVSAGTTRVRARTFNNKYAYCTVNVHANPTSFSFAEPVYTVKEGATVNTALVFEPAGSFGTAQYTFIPDEDARAVANANGSVKGELSGSGTLTAVVYNWETGEDLSASCNVVIENAPCSVSIGNARSVIGVEEIITLEPVAYDGHGDRIATTFTVKSSDTAKVAVSGLALKGVRTATVTITVTAANGMSRAFKTKVVAEASAISLNATSVKLQANGMLKLNATVKGISDCSVRWASSDNSVATVSADGLVKALKPGTAVIAVTPYNGKVTARCTVYVLPEAESVSFVDDTYIVGENGKRTVSAILPEGTLSQIVYASANPFVAEVDAVTGCVTGIHTGKTTITATIRNSVTGKYASAEYTIDVRPAPVSIVLTNTRRTVGYKEKMELCAVAYDKNGEETYGAFTYGTSNKSYVAVDGNGVVYGAKAGKKADITVRAYNGVYVKYTYSCVTEPTAVALNAKAITLSQAETFKFTWSLSKGSTGKCYFASSNPAVASIDENGMLQAHELGTTTVTCTTYNGKSASCAVTVLSEPDAIEFNAHDYSVGEGDSIQIAASLPEGQKGTIHYFTEDEFVTVDEFTGKVKGVKNGVAVVTARVTNLLTGDIYTDTCRVNVTPAPAYVVLNIERTTIGLNELLYVSATAYDANGEETPSSFTYASSNTSYLKVSGSAIKGVRAGTVTLRVTSYNGKIAQKSLKVVAAPTAVKLNASAVSLVEGFETYKLIPTLSAKGAVSRITWVSENSAIATVDEDGTIHGVSYGQTRIKASTYNGKYALCTVYVYNQPESIELNTDKLELGVGQTANLSYTLNAQAGGKVTFSSEDTSIATVDASGRVTGAGEGATRISATTINGITVYCSVTVKKAPEYIRFKENSITIGVGQVYDLENIYELSEGSSSTRKYAVESSSILSLVNGTSIKGVKAGSTRVRVDTYNGKYALMTVKVQAQPTTFAIVCSAENVYAGDNVVFSAKFPAGTMGSVKFASSDPSVLTITEDGAAQALDCGTVMISAVSHNQVHINLTLTVLRHVEEVVISETDLTLTHYDTASLSYVIVPDDASNKNVTWYSEDTTKVTIDQNGNLEAVGVTESPVAVYARAEEGNKVGICMVTVLPVRLTGFALSTDAAELERGRTYETQVTFTPANADDKRLTWESDNESAVTVDENGVLTAVSDTGSAVITATSADGGYRQSMSVNVTKVHLNELAFDQSSIELIHYDTLSLEPAVSPFDADIDVTAWSSSDETVLSVSESGMLTALKPGEVMVTLTLTDSFGTEKSASVNVTVLPVPVESISLGTNVMYLRAGQQELIELVIAPDNADNKSVSFNLKPEDIISAEAVEGGVLVTAGDEAGSVELTVTSADSGLTAGCLINVLDALSINEKANFAKNTVGNDVVWTLSVANAIGNASYEIVVLKDGETLLDTDCYNSETGIVIAAAAEGTYTLNVTVTDMNGDTATAVNTVTVNDAIACESGSLLYSYRIYTCDNGVQGAAVKLIGGGSGLKSITVPEQLDGVNVVRIDTEGFMNLTELETVNIPFTVCELGARAFMGCSALTSIKSY